MGFTGVFITYGRDLLSGVVLITSIETQNFSEESFKGEILLLRNNCDKVKLVYVLFNLQVDSRYLELAYLE